MIKKIVTAFVFLVALSINSQQNKINNYKYVIVQEKFDFLKEANQYQTSSLTKFLLKKKGFTVFLSNENLPAELKVNRCLALNANVIDESGLFSIKSKIELKDCNENLLYTSKEGKSKEKNYKKGYQEAIRKAYATMRDLKYSYQPLEKETLDNKIPSKKELIAPVKKAIPVNTVSQAKKIIPSIAIENTQSTAQTIGKNVLYAQAVKNGFQLVNTKPSVVFVVLKTNVKDVFILKDSNGILYNNNNNWVAEYYKNGVLIVEKYQIKF